MKISVLSLLPVLVFTSCLNFEVSAQEVAQTTPREDIVKGLGPDRAGGTVSVPAETSSGQTAYDNSNISDRIRKFVTSLDAEAETEENSVVIIDEITSVEKNAPILVPDLVIPTSEVSKPAPFYLTATDYLDIRGRESLPQAVLSYKVSTQKRGVILPVVRTLTLVLGPDYASVTSGNTTKLYDFKLNRLLTLSGQVSANGTQTGRVQFDNVSLYSRVYRNIQTVRNITADGKTRTIAVGKDETLDAFWIESAMSWAALEAKNGLEITAEQMPKKGALDVVKNGETVFKARFTAQPFKTLDLRDSLLAFAHHEWPLHPKVLQALYGFETSANYIEMLSYGPKAPEGEVQIWELIDQSFQNAKFPLSPNAQSISERKPAVPLAFVINEAVQGRARGGLPTPMQITQNFYTELDADETLKAWVLGQKYDAYTGACHAGDVDDVCAALSTLEAGDADGDLHTYMQAQHLAKDPSTRIEAVKLLEPYLSDKKTPAIVLRTAAMARAKIKSLAAQEAGLGQVNAEKILNQALAKDPYDPNTYVGLAQVFAASGALEQSWDIYDALRTGIPTVRAVTLKIDGVEARLRATAPGYFLDDH